MFLARPSLPPSICPSVCQSVPHVLVTRKQKNVEESNQISINVPQGTSKWSANFQLKRTKVKVTERQKPKKIAACLAYTCMSTYGRWLRRRLQTRLNPFIGLIYCRRLRRSATGRTAAYHVGTRRRHLFLFIF